MVIPLSGWGIVSREMIVSFSCRGRHLPLGCLYGVIDIRLHPWLLPHSLERDEDGWGEGGRGRRHAGTAARLSA